MVKLHKVTIFVVDPHPEEPNLDKLIGDCYHNGSKIVEIQTAEFDREWDDDDVLNKTTTWNSRNALENMVENKPSQHLIPFPEK